jgi:CHAT domain-containing protein/tetratricopeptide (TPR) repeat protein
MRAPRSLAELDAAKARLVRLFAEGNYPEALETAWSALELAMQHFGPRDLETALAWNNLAEIRRAAGDYDGAEPLYRHAIEICRGSSDDGGCSMLGACLNNLAEALRCHGRYREAEPLLLEALGLLGSVGGTADPVWLSCYGNLAVLYRAQGRLAEAAPILWEVAERTREVLGAGHPDFAAALNNLAELYSAIGYYAEAEQYFERVLEIRRQTAGEATPECAVTLHNLGALHQAAGRFAKAEEFYRRALEIRRRMLGALHPDTAVTLSGLAGVLVASGNYSEAAALFGQALDIFEEAGGDPQPVAETLSRFAGLYHLVEGGGPDAAALCMRAIDLCRDSLGDRHPVLANCLDSLGAIQCTAGEWADARTCFERALAIRREALGDSHPEFAVSLSNVAETERLEGRWDEAERLLRQSLSIFRAALGELHPLGATTERNLAAVCAAGGREGEAFDLLREAGWVDRDLIRQLLGFGSDRQRLSYLESIQSHLHMFLSLVRRWFARDEARVAAALDLVLQWKCLAADAAAMRRDAVLGGRYPELEPELRRLGLLRAQIARKILDGPGPEGLEAHAELLRGWSAERDRIEATLARSIPEVELDNRLLAAGRQVVAMALPGGSVLVEFVRSNIFDFTAVPAKGDPQWLPSRYLAFVLSGSGGVSLLDLGDAGAIDDMIETFRKLLSSRLERGAGAEPCGELEPDARDLAGALLGPLRPVLGDCRRLFLAPDGDLTRMPFEVLSAGNGKHVLDEYGVSYVTTGRDLLRFGAVPVPEAGPPVVAADPDFDLGGDEEREGSCEVSGLFRDLAAADIEFTPLPCTRFEGEAIGSILGVRPWLGGEVQEGRLKSCRRPRILHLATHGFFLPDPPRGPGSRTAGPGFWNPMLRSGLALAGAETRRLGGTPPPGAEDGLLTAEDVSALDLYGSELAVLSACETGLGGIRAGQGVLGLRRAFVLAGARTLVMSLWRVPDLASAILMESFYEYLWIRGLPRGTSLRKAQQRLRDLTVGELRRNWLATENIESLFAVDEELGCYCQELAGFPDNHRPFADAAYWGAFICQGEPGPLRPPS